jgi:hexosaminidase
MPLNIPTPRSVVMAAAIAFGAVFLHLVQAEENPALRVIPSPQTVVAAAGRFTISQHTTIILDRNSPEERFAASQINIGLAEMHRSALTVTAAGTIRSLPASFIYLGGPDSKVGARLLKQRGASVTPVMNEEGYILDIRARGVYIIGPSEKGKFYGVMTALQMLRRAGKSIVMDAATIIDYPFHKMRGISDDISRGQVSTPDNFKKIIRFLARYKMNTYSPYIEDMVAFSRHPLIGRGRGALTPEELKELDDYARHYYVDIVPIFQTLGHWENILAIPEYVGLAEYRGGRTVNVSDEKVYVLLDEMIGEICHSLHSPYFNIGADETRDVGLGANKDCVAKQGLAAVLAGHYKRVADIVRRHGKIPMIYGDMILKNPEILAMIPRDIIVVDWDYDPRYHYESPNVFRKAGFDVLASPGVLSYRGPFLDILNSFSNIQRFSRDAYQDNAVGVLISSWNDYGGEQLRELNYYGYAWGAQCAWQPLRSDVSTFDKAFFSDFFGTFETEAIESVYALLASPANHFSWFELWRHPMLPFVPRTPLKGHSPIVMERLQSIESTMPLVLSLLTRAEHAAVRNRDQLQVLEFIARLNLWFAKKVQTQETVQELSRRARASAQKDSVIEAIIQLSARVRSDLASLKDEFRTLWLRTNKPEGFELLCKRYDRQAAYWQEKIDEVTRGEFWVDPEIVSSWIYHPDAPTTAAAPMRIQHAFFRKTFAVSGSVHSAQLQLIGDTFVNVSVNGHMVGEVYVRRSNSLNAEHQRIRIFDIASFLSDSANVVTAEALDYSTAGSAGLNIYCELRDAQGAVRRIVSDTTWKVSTAAGSQWMTTAFDDSQWSFAVVKPYPYPIIRPEMTSGRSSWIEQ